MQNGEIIFFFFYNLLYSSQTRRVRRFVRVFFKFCETVYTVFFEMLKFGGTASHLGYNTSTWRFPEVRTRGYTRK